MSNDGRLWVALSLAALAAAGQVTGSRGKWTWTTARAEAEAALHEGMSDSGSFARDFIWTFERLPLAAFEGLMSGASWKRWTRNELKMSRDDGSEYRDNQRKWWKTAFASSEDPVVAVVGSDGCVEELWDGWHRTGFSHLDGMPFVPVLVGRKGILENIGSRGLARAGRRKPQAPEQVMATVQDDDDGSFLDFDVVLYLAQASKQDLVALRDCGWGGDYPADNVAWFCTKFNEDLDGFMDDVEKTGTGFEVHVNEEHARAWLAVHRPDWETP